MNRPTERVVWHLSALDAMFLRTEQRETPQAIPSRGGALNITCISYAGQLNIGFTAGRDSVPHMQKMAVYVAEALDELEVDQRPL